MARKIKATKARGVFKTCLITAFGFRPVRLFCEECDKYVPGDAVWVCGHCNEENQKTKYYSFLNKCANCKRPAKSFVCPHCGVLNYLDKHRVGSHPARLIGVIETAVEPTSEQLRAMKREAHADRKEGLTHEIEIARLSQELAKYKASGEFDAEKKAMQLKMRFTEHDAHLMGVAKIAKQRRAEIPIEFKDDPELRERAEESVQMFIENESL